MKFFPSVLTVFGFLLLHGCGSKQDTNQVDLAFVNGRVWTGIDSTSFAEAVSIKGNIIERVGSSDEIKKSVGGKTKVIDLQGRLLIPGFNDAHIHFLSGSMGLTEVDLMGAGTIAEVVQRIKKFAMENPTRKWITGRGWQYTMFANGLPSKEILDSAVQDRPIFIRAYDGHSAWANSAALKLVKITTSTKFNDFGEIVRARNGEPTGVFKERAMSLIADNIPAPSEEEELAALRKGLTLASSLGITSIANASGTPKELKLYQRLLKDNELTVRVAAAFSVGANTTEEEIRRYVVLKDSVGKNVRLTVGAVKFMLDGVIESHTAAMLEPYSNLTPNEPFPTGTFALLLDRYRSLVAQFDKLGFRVYTHAIGDGAVREALNAYELAAQVNGTSGRHRVEHIETISPVDLPRFAQLEVLPSMEPIHAEPGTISVWAEGVGPARLPYSFAWASIIRAGGKLVFSSDWPACVSLNPIGGLHTAVTRRTVEGEPKAGWVPEQKISISKALTAYTQGGAYSSFEENLKGRIAPGHLADLIVLSQNLFEIDPMKTHETRVVMTIFDGKVIYTVQNP